ncbi:MAG: class I SAM-dependent methyltransferase [Rhizobiaceae bacterium]|nr:class I SAM-dependent methyltransferase [Rhizobiaceae bacterium]
MTEASDKIKAIYDWRHALGGTNKDYKPIAQADVDLLKKYIDLTTAKVCDVGCGGGAHLGSLLKAGVRFPVGIDLSSRALAALLEGNDADKILLVHGDVTLWQMRQSFDAVICSLPPLAHEGRMCLQPFVGTLYNLLNQGGVLLLKLITLESVVSIVGSYTVNYDGAKCGTCSEVTYDQFRRTMRIVQHSIDTPDDIMIEELALPSSEDVFMAIAKAGFSAEQLIDDRIFLLPGTQTFVARS